MFAYRPRVERSLRRPCSGRTLASTPHLGPPMAPTVIYVLTSCYGGARRTHEDSMGILASLKRVRRQRIPILVNGATTERQRHQSQIEFIRMSRNDHQYSDCLVDNFWS
jgi:hypothetical protein